MVHPWRLHKIKRNDLRQWLVHPDISHHSPNGEGWELQNVMMALNVILCVLVFTDCTNLSMHLPTLVVLTTAQAEIRMEVSGREMN
jgi:hypothetical protein